MNKYLSKIAEKLDFGGDGLKLRVKTPPLKPPKVLDPPSFKDTMPSKSKPVENLDPPKIKPIE